MIKRTGMRVKVEGGAGKDAVEKVPAQVGIVSVKAAKAVRVVSIQLRRPHCKCACASISDARGEIIWAAYLMQSRQCG